MASAPRSPRIRRGEESLGFGLTEPVLVVGKLDQGCQSCRPDLACRIDHTSKKRAQRVAVRQLAHGLQRRDSDFRRPFIRFGQPAQGLRRLLASSFGRAAAATVASGASATAIQA